MKKALIVLLLLAVAGGLFAQTAPAFTIQGRIDTWWLPFQSVTRDVSDGAGGTKSVTVPAAGLGRDTNNADPNNYGAGLRARLFGAAQTDNFGLRIWLQFFPMAGGGATSMIGFDDCVDAWWKPVSWFKLDVGKFVDDTLRGKISDDAWMDALTLISADGDEIFTRFRGQGFNSVGGSNAGVLATFSFANVGNGDLGFYALFPSLNPFAGRQHAPIGITLTGGDKGNLYEAPVFADGNNQFFRVYERTQGAISYNIKNVGLIRAQYVGANKVMGAMNPAGSGRKDATAPRIEAAFLLSMVNNLTLDIGGKVPLLVKGSEVNNWVTIDSTNVVAYLWQKADPNSKAEWQNPYQASIGVKYVMLDNNALTLWGRVDGKFGGYYDDGTDKVNFGPEINLHLNPYYNLGFMTLGLDVGFGFIGKSTNDIATYNGGKDLDGGTRFGAGIYALKQLNPTCSVKGGFAYSAGTKVNGVQEDAVFSIPVVLDYTF